MAKFANVTFMGVKPYQIVDVLSEFPFMTSANLVISMAAGVKLSTMAEVRLRCFPLKGKSELIGRP